MSAKHTPTPWRWDKSQDEIVDRNGCTVAYHLEKTSLRDVDAELIVHAVNLFDVLLSNLKFEHREAVGEAHFELIGEGNMGCSVCALILKAEARP